MKPTDAASKVALQRWCRENNWKVVFFESASSARRTGIVDVVMTRIKPSKPDAIEVRLVQLKACVAGLKAAEISRLKKAVSSLSTDWLLAAYDGATLHLVPDVPKRGDEHAGRLFGTVPLGLEVRCTFFSAGTCSRRTDHLPHGRTSAARHPQSLAQRLQHL